ncbi:MAG: hypothetical protein HY647_03780 [Acidobacteria bacterium]|nr:hypothetical protein [Acidobacteriota bacterium]
MWQWLFRIIREVLGLTLDLRDLWVLAVGSGITAIVWGFVRDLPPGAQTLLLLSVFFASVAMVGQARQRWPIVRWKLRREIQGKVASECEPRLEIDLVDCEQLATVEWLGGGQEATNPQFLLFKANLLPTGKMQVFEIWLQIGDEQIDLLGEPIYASAIKLPCFLGRPETHVLRFKIPRRLDGKGTVKAKVCARAAGAVWESREIEIKL